MPGLGGLSRGEARGEERLKIVFPEKNVEVRKSFITLVLRSAIMQITVTAGEQVFTVEVPPDMEIENVKALCEAESGIAMAEMVLLLDGKALSDDKQTAVAAGLKDGEMVLLQRRPRPGQQGQGGVHMPDFSQIVVPGPSSSSSSHPARHSDDPQMIRDMLRANPDQLALLRQNNVRLAEAYDSGSMEEFAKVRSKRCWCRFTCY